MQEEHQYTERELRIIAEAAVDEFLMSVMLNESDDPTTDITITQRGRGILGGFLMAASGLVTAIPLVGWILGPILILLAKMGILEDYVADYLEGKANITTLIEKLERVVYGIVSKVPTAGIRPLAGRVMRRVADAKGRKAISVYVNNRAKTEKEQVSLLATLYLTDVIMEMMQKNIKLPKSVGKGKIKIPTDRSGQGLIVINAQHLPTPYNFLHGVQGEIEAEIIDAGEEAWEDMSEEEVEEIIIDIDSEDGGPQPVPQLPGPSGDLDQYMLPMSDDPDDLSQYLIPLDDEDEDDKTDPMIRERRYLQQLDDELKVIAMINEVKHTRE